LAEKNVDLGENIRLKAKNIVWLLTNQDELKKEVIDAVGLIIVVNI
jgi:hypothetical protein